MYYFIWLSSLSTIILAFIHVVEYIYSSPIFVTILLYGHAPICLSIGLLVNAMVWICVSHSNSCVEIPIPNVTVLGGRAFREWLGQESGALMNESNDLIKEI